MQINKDYIDIKYPSMNSNYIKLNLIPYGSDTITPIWINKVMIITLQNTQDGTYITLFNDKGITVKETTEEILKLI